MTTEDHIDRSADSSGSDGPSFSIIMPVLNMASTIARALDSILAQTYSNYEIIVIDGASSDGTIDVVRSYGDRVSRLISEPDDSLYHAINKGVELAAGDIIGILNGDDLYAHPEVLARYAERFLDPEVNVVFADLAFFPSDDPQKTVRTYSSSRFRPYKLRLGWMPPHPTVFVRREVYANVGLYRTDYRISADYEFLIRVFLDPTTRHERIDEVVVRMQHGGLSTSGIRATYRLNSEIIRGCRENGLYTNWLLLLMKIPAKLMEYFFHRS